MQDENQFQLFPSRKKCVFPVIFLHKITTQPPLNADIGHVIFYKYNRQHVQTQ